MKYRPDRTIIAVLGGFCLICSIGLAGAWVQYRMPVTLLCSGVALVVSAFLLMPVARNQIVETGVDGIILYSFGRGIELNADDLFEVVRRKNGVLSYRFYKADFSCQITPHAYRQGKSLQDEFDWLFSLDDPAVNVIERGQQNKPME